MRSFAGVLLAAILLSAGLSGCQKLFTTSLAEGLARSDLPVPSSLTTSQAAELAAQAKAQDDSKLATALVSSLVGQIASTTDAATKKDLETSAATAAIVASGTSSALTGLVDAYASGSTPTAADLISLADTIKAGATTDVVTALLYLDSGLSAADATAAGLGATDLAIAAVVVAASALPADTDPSALTGADLTAYLADPAVVSAVSILQKADTMVTAGSESAKLLDQITGYFSLPTS